MTNDKELVARLEQLKTVLKAAPVDDYLYAAWHTEVLEQLSQRLQDMQGKYEELRNVLRGPGVTFGCLDGINYMSPIPEGAQIVLDDPLPEPPEE